MLSEHVQKSQGQGLANKVFFVYMLAYVDVHVCSPRSQSYFCVIFCIELLGGGGGGGDGGMGGGPILPMPILEKSRLEMGKKFLIFFQ